MIKMVLEVKTTKLYDIGFACAWLILNHDNTVLEEDMHACHPCITGFFDKEEENWIQENIKIDYDCTFAYEVRNHFWESWLMVSRMGGYLFSKQLIDSFIRDCVVQERGRGLFAPEPIYDINSIMFARNIGTSTRLDNELPEHNPLCDARYAARLLIGAMNVKM